MLKFKLEVKIKLDGRAYLNNSCLFYVLRQRNEYVSVGEMLKQSLSKYTGTESL